jgi:predicted enzyme related to lactoylglutathione lyase
MNPQQPVMWLLSFVTTNTDATCEAAKQAGAQVWMGPMDIGPLGRWALLSDPTGAPFAVWQGREFKGFGVVDEPKAVSWVDLATRDADKALTFYQTLFGWEVEAAGDYRMVGLDGKRFGGIMAMGDMFPPEVPSHWTPFIQVEDADATAASAGQLGADVMHGPEDVPVKTGPRIAVVRDPHGATFGVLGPRKG